MAERPRLAVVVGASGGIGAAFVELLVARRGIDRVVGVSRRRPAGWRDDPRRIWTAADITDEAELDAAAQTIGALGAPTLVVIASGVLQGDGLAPEKTYRAVSGEALARYFAVNSTGPALVAARLLPLMPRAERSVLAVLSARVGSIGDNRLGGWYGYRASKAALNMLVKTLAIEHRRTHPEAVLAALHPGTVRSALSEPFLSGGAGDRALEPRRSAEALLDVLDSLTPEDSGGFFAWDGQSIPW